MQKVSENKFIPKLRFKEFKNDWKKHLLGDIATFHKGKGISKADIDDKGDTECIRYGELYTNYSEMIYNVNSKTNLKDVVLSQANDVIIPASGETHIDIATASCVLRDGIALGGDLNIIRTKNNGLFLSYYLNNKAKLEIAKLSQGSSVIHLYSVHLKILKLNLPNILEQQKIASFISLIDKRLQQLTKKKELLEKYKKGIIQRIYTQKLRFKDSNGNNFPNWELKKLGDVLIEVNDKTKISNQYEILSSTKKGLFKQGEYFTRDIASKDNKGYKILRKNQLVFSPQNLWLGNINLNLKYEVGIVSPSYKIFSFNKEVELTYFKDFLKTPKMLYEYTKSSEQGASIVRRNLDMSLFKSIKLFLPSIEEQKKIGDFLSALDKKIEIVNTQIEKTKSFKKGLLQQMFV